jgi:hypothetical protein
MGDPWVPPYFGSYQQLLQEELNNPRLGTYWPGHFWVVTADAARRHPQPWPWVVDALASAVAVRALAAGMPHGPGRSQLRGSADAAIQQILDDYCGTPPRLVPWPWPGPPPWVFAIALQLTAMANTMEEGAMRNGLLEVAGQVVNNLPLMHHKNDPPGPPPAPQGPGGGGGPVDPESPLGPK